MRLRHLQPLLLLQDQRRFLSRLSTRMEYRAHLLRREKDKRDLIPTRLLLLRRLLRIITVGSRPSLLHFLLLLANRAWLKRLKMIIHFHPLLLLLQGLRVTAGAFMNPKGERVYRGRACLARRGRHLWSNPDPQGHRPLLLLHRRCA